MNFIFQTQRITIKTKRIKTFKHDFLKKSMQVKHNNNF